MSCVSGVGVVVVTIIGVVVVTIMICVYVGGMYSISNPYNTTV